MPSVCQAGHGRALPPVLDTTSHGVKCFAGEISNVKANAGPAAGVGKKWREGEDAVVRVGVRGSVGRVGAVGCSWGPRRCWVRSGRCTRTARCPRSWGRDRRWRRSWVQPRTRLPGLALGRSLSTSYPSYLSREDGWGTWVISLPCKKSLP